MSLRQFVLKILHKVARDKLGLPETLLSQKTRLKTDLCIIPDLHLLARSRNRMSRAQGGVNMIDRAVVSDFNVPSDRFTRLSRPLPP
ncbi:hypothetical protein Y032_0044g1069 [Ancylostoma ceylanicum]|uniref:Uncharacterized protein n=1 Tax=Ancylostoma ceylanicum TaxID=53326 RepID=A0A016UEA8_9BILA|nr:hypothetical protein Y032_0044g1069 [Ancylostoma ceylanicum]